MKKALLVLGLLLLISSTGWAATRTVTNCNDSGAGSLRQAITDAGVSDTVVFNITTAEASYSTGEAYPGLVTTEATGKSWFRIILNSFLPAIISNNVWVQGSTQPLTESNNPSGPEVEVRMNGTNGHFSIGDGGPVVTGVTIEGLTINRRGGIDGGNGIALNNAQSCQILGCFIGISATGEGLSPNKNALGICPYNLSANNKIGNGTAGGRNIISGNASSGIYIADPGTTGNQILGNYIGTNSSGTAALANDYGICIQPGASQNYIGDGTAGGRNIISGNATGVYITGTNANSNEVLGNYIGTTATGEAALPNISIGVYTASNASYNKIGKDISGCGNIISGNDYGIYLVSSTNEVLGNYIGLSASGLKLANPSAGIQIAGTNNKIGNGTTLGRNIISGNTNYGIILQGIGSSYYAEILGNYIGTNVDGTAAIGNAYGIYSNADRNKVGDGTDGGRNVISGNSVDGIWFSIGCTNEVYGNYIGLNAAGTTALANAYDGVHISGDTAGGAVGNKIGAAGKGNVISKNGMHGIRVYRDLSKAADNTGFTTILANFIGSNASMIQGFGNGRSGVSITSSEGNYIGDGVPGDANLIFSHTNGAADDAGIRIYGSPSKNNYILGNYIFYNYRGIQSLCSANNNKIGNGATNGRNYICQNTEHGIMIHDSGTNSNEVIGNYIGVLEDGSAYGNTWYGIYIYNGASFNKIGNGSAGGSNIIASNGNSTYPDGIRIEGASTKNIITRNSIFSNNGKGIKLLSGGNNEIASPEITSAGYNELTGITQITGFASAEPGGTVEVYKAQANQGKTYLTSVAPDGSGIWSVSLTGLVSGDAIVATGTTANPETSEFSTSREVITSLAKQYQPDNIIATLESGTDYLGEGIFNTTGLDQTRIRSITTGESAIYYVKIKIAGNTTDEAIVTGTAGIGNWSAAYYDAKTGGNNITSQVVGSGWSTGSLGSAETKEIRLEVQNSGTALSTFEGSITSTSSRDGVTKDVVKASATAIPIPPKVNPIDHFAISAPGGATARTAFTATITARDVSGGTVEVEGTTSLSIDTGTITPDAIAAAAFTGGVWTGNISLGTPGSRTITVTNGPATGTAVITITNATREYTSAELGVPGMSITIPAGAATADVTVTASIVTAPGAPPAGYSVGGQTFSIISTPVNTFLIPVTVTIPITGPLVAPKVQYWTGTAWSTNGITIISYTTTSLTFTTTHFTIFAPMTTLATNRVRFGPNPYNPNNGSGHFWYWLDADTETSIYLIDLAGTVQFKQTYTAGTNGGKIGENNIAYNGNTAWGDQLGQGVYIYKIVQGGKAIGGGKIAVVK